MWTGCNSTIARTGHPPHPSPGSTRSGEEQTCVGILTRPYSTGMFNDSYHDRNHTSLIPGPPPGPPESRTSVPWRVDGAGRRHSRLHPARHTDAKRGGDGRSPGVGSKYRVDRPRHHPHSYPDW